MDSRDYWDGEAAHFDDEPDHGLADPATREAWRQLLNAHLPMPPRHVVDAGCGTGTLSVLMAEAGHRVRGVDLSPRMIAAANAKATAAGLQVDFMVGDAGRPPYDVGSCDAVVCRHVLWALPDPVEALAGWVSLLRPGGRLVLVEGRWHTGGGITAADCMELVGRTPGLTDPQILPLDEDVYWGGPITDERYVLAVRAS